MESGAKRAGERSSSARPGRKIIVTQSGIIAGNAFYNDLVINSSEKMCAPFRASANGIVHAISLPAWDILDLTAPDVGSIDLPVWSPEAHEINSRHISRKNTPWNLAFSARRTAEEVTRPPSSSHLSESGDQLGDAETTPIGTTGLSFPERLVRRAYGQMMRFRLNTAVVALVRRATRRVTLVFGWVVASLRIRSRGPWVHVSNGAMQLPFANPRPWGAINVLLEHGTVRWSFGEPSGDARERRAYQEMCREADHVWVTNLDVRTLELIESVAPGRWSALPHPYHLDPCAPYSEDIRERDRLKIQLDAEFLIFSGSSLSLGGDQNKGTNFLIEALSDLVNDEHLPIGLVVTNWGRDVEAVKSLLKRYRLENRVLIIPPMSRTRLQMTMANCDLVSDQFHLDAFGGLAIRALEQGMPVLTRGLSDLAREYIGELPPFLSAHDRTTITNQILSQMEVAETLGRDEYIRSHCVKSRGWLLRRHHHGITAKLQQDRYLELASSRSTPATSNAWALLPDWTTAE